MTFNGTPSCPPPSPRAIVIGLAFFLKAKVTSTGVPGGVQLFFEAITIQMRQQIESAIGMKVAPFVLPLAVALFVLHPRLQLAGGPARAVRGFATAPPPS